MLVNAAAIALSFVTGVFAVGRRLKYRNELLQLDALCNGTDFLTADQVARELKVDPTAVRMAVHRGALCPAKHGGQLVFTRRDVERYRGQREEHRITRALTRGAHPLDVYLDAGGDIPLERVTAVMSRWAKLTGKWVIEGPRGSYARWLQRLGLTVLPPRALRRVVELLLADPYVQRLVLSQLPRLAPPEPVELAPIELGEEPSEASQAAPEALLAQVAGTTGPTSGE